MKLIKIAFKFLAAFLVGFSCYYLFISDESGCRAYSSKYSCRYLIEQAHYDVFYGSDLIGTVKGLVACKDKAIQWTLTGQIHFEESRYLCFLVRDGVYKESHRLL